MKPFKTATVISALSAIGYLGCQVIGAVQERFADTAGVQNPVDAGIIQDTSNAFLQDTVYPSLEQAVYDYLVHIGTDKNGFQTPLRTWGKTIDEIGAGYLDEHVNTVVAITKRACEEYTFSREISCPALMTALFLQESQLYAYATSPYAAGIAQLGIETAVEHTLAIPQGPKYNAWMQAREKRLDFHKPDMTHSEKQTYQRLLKEEQARLKRYKHAVSQLSPSTFDERYNPECAIPSATAVMSELLGQYHGNLEQALHAYNYGVGNLQKAEDTGLKLPTQTQVHATKIMGLYEELRINAF